MVKWLRMCSHDAHNGTSAVARFFKLKTWADDGSVGPPAIAGVVVRSNTFTTSDYRIAVSDTAFLPGTVIEDNRFDDERGVLAHRISPAER